MLEIQFNKDYPQTGNKAGDKIKIKANAISGPLKGYVDIVETPEQVKERAKLEELRAKEAKAEADRLEAERVRLEKEEHERVKNENKGKK